MLCSIYLPCKKDAFWKRKDSRKEKIKEKKKSKKRFFQRNLCLIFKTQKIIFTFYYYYYLTISWKNFLKCQRKIKINKNYLLKLSIFQFFLKNLKWITIKTLSFLFWKFPMYVNFGVYSQLIKWKRSHFNYYFLHPSYLSFFNI